MQKARVLLRWGNSFVLPSLLGALFEQHSTKLGTLLSVFAFHLKGGSWSTGSVQERT